MGITAPPPVVVSIDLGADTASDPTKGTQHETTYWHKPRKGVDDDDLYICISTHSALIQIVTYGL